ncbi:YggT family protein [Janibacter melonis]|jgi:YggT family protein|uniref:YggT family protein n=1 Tax=Janibacter melonis TaxID=262209 RepID=A0A176QAQ6_9MICO|nr:YggT family protein [Janibacter melonis]MBD5830048.1 YggT family protein [Janibacter melonis]MCB5990494.1 YggT family protein [Janibacter melonis]MCM3555735.1 YggT family protein [Janibacter melonis]OAB86821.1 hypothetical protein AWH69_10380 [Janibacter melonis]QFQ30422.2 YggT family protein [Janibacter melonis]
MELIRAVVHLVLYAFFLVLIGRLIFDWIQVFAREWRPRGIVLVVAEVVYSITDPPLKAIRKVIPPLRLGGVQLDLAFLVLILGVSILLRII